jgi:hypothetical protein
VVGYFVAGRRASRFTHAVIPVIGAVVTLWVIAEASRLALTVGACWACAGLVIALSQRLKRHP